MSAAKYRGEASSDIRSRKRVINADIDDIDRAAVIDTVMQWCADGETNFIVNPNLDCLVKLHETPRLQQVYRHAGLVLADGWPLVLWSRLKGRRLSRVAGADLVVPLCRKAADNGFSVFLLGSTLPSLSGAARQIRKQIPTMNIAGVYSPPMGFGETEQSYRDALEAINAAKPDIVFLAFGAPKQEYFADAVCDKVEASALICVGAALDFLSRKQKRAPFILRRMQLEWLWRIAMEPRRVGPRYLHQIAMLPRMIRHYWN